LVLIWTGLVTTLRPQKPQANQPRSNSSSVSFIEVRHFINAHRRGVLLAELRVFFIRPWRSRAGSLGVEPTVSERRSLMAALASGRLIYAPLDHLNVLGGPAFDYLIFDPEEGFESVMPEPPALEFVAVVGRASRGVGIGAFDRATFQNKIFLGRVAWQDSGLLRTGRLAGLHK
jgi:hypothetical protein